MKPYLLLGFAGFKKFKFMFQLMILSSVGELGLSSRSLELDNLDFCSSSTDVKLSVTVHCEEILLLCQENRLQQIQSFCAVLRR